MTRWNRIRRQRSRAVAAVALAAGSLLAVPAMARAAPLTVVTIQFDDGNADTIQWIDGSLNNHGFHATWYINSGSIGTAGKLTWAQLTSLNAAGDEIGSHTVDHVDLKKLKLSDARFQVCQDRVNLAAH